MKNTAVFLGHRRAVVGAAGVSVIDRGAVRRTRVLSPMTLGTAVVAVAPTVDADALAAAAAAPAQRTAPGVRPRGAPV